jgi:hypothetical protein
MFVHAANSSTLRPHLFVVVHDRSFGLGSELGSAVCDELLTLLLHFLSLKLDFIHLGSKARHIYPLVDERVGELPAARRRWSRRLSSRLLLQGPHCGIQDFKHLMVAWLVSQAE